MLRYKFIVPFVLLTAFLAGAIGAFAQTAPVSGYVEMKKEDGSAVRVEGATVDCYRVDSNLSCRSTTTNSRGEFTFLGIPFSGKVVLAVSGPGLSPIFFPDVKAGQENIVIEVRAGDGSKLTEEEVRAQYAQYAANPTGELTEDQKKAQEEYERKVAEIKSKNAKIEEKNKVIEMALKAGNEAYSKGDYGTAIAQYEVGVEADPDFVGSAPVLLNNKGAALKKRAVETYNAAAKSKDQAQIASAKTSAGGDLASALDSYSKSWDILLNAKAEEISDQNNYKSSKLNAADGGRDAVRLMVLIKTVDGSKTDEAKKLTDAYVAGESDKKKQADAQANLAAYMFEGGNFDGSVAEYRKAYSMSPKDPDVLAKFGLALYTVAESNQDEAQKKAMKEESLGVMEAYLSAAPKDHELRADIQSLADYLKNTEKIKPQKLN